MELYCCICCIRNTANIGVPIMIGVCFETEIFAESKFWYKYP